MSETLPASARGLLLALGIATALWLTPSLAAEHRPFRALPVRGDVFTRSIETEKPAHIGACRATGITVPHHLLAADLIARAFWAASCPRITRVIVMSPDHFSKAKRAFAVSARDFDTVFGRLKTDARLARQLIAHRDLIDDSSLFEREHGITGIMPYVRRIFPRAKVFPIAVSLSSQREDWDELVSILKPLIDERTLIVQSTDFSHYLSAGLAALRDQQTLHLIAAHDLDGLAKLRQPDYIDSTGAQYLQMRLQSEIFAAYPLVIANRNSAEYSGDPKITTSYIVQLFRRSHAFDPALSFADQSRFFIAGDTLLGRGFARMLATPNSNRAIREIVAGFTGGAPLIVNLEGVILEHPPPGLPPTSHIMAEQTAIPFLRELNVVAANLANNHAFDLGQDGLDETVRLLKRGGITPLGHASFHRLFGVTFAAYNVVRQNTGAPVLAEHDLTALKDATLDPPLVALLHWGKEYTTAPRVEEIELAGKLRLLSVSAVIGAHSHQASTATTAPAGGTQSLLFSLGNFLFDQTSDRASGALLEVRVFGQGTYSIALHPLPNIYDGAQQNLIEH